MSDRLAELRELTRAATPGPWVDGAGDIFAEGVLGDDGMVRDGECEVASCYSRNRHADEAFIVATRNALPALLDVAEAARENAYCHAPLTSGRGPEERIVGPCGQCSGCRTLAALARLDGDAGAEEEER